MTAEMAKVEFYGDTLEALPEGERVLVSVRRCCENLGLAFQVQLRKLRAKAWACVTDRVIHDASGRKQPAVMIPHDRLPMWLAGIDSRRVKEEVREKLARYQNECADVLARHFLRERPACGPGLDPEALVSRVFEQVVARLAVRGPHNPGDGWTVEERIAELYPGWNATAGQRAAIRKKTNNDLRLARFPDHLYFGDRCVYVERMIHFLDKAIHRKYRIESIAGRVESHNLFDDGSADPRKPR